MMKAASKSNNSAVKAQADALNDYTYQNYKLFSKVGITMNADRTLSIDEDTFKKVNEKTGSTNVPTLTTLFKGIGSFADKAADRARPGKAKRLLPPKPNMPAARAVFLPVTRQTVPTRLLPQLPKTRLRQLPQAHFTSLLRSWEP